MTPEDFAAHLRVGSVEITAALAIVAVVAARPRVRATAEIGRLTPMRIDLEILQPSGNRELRAHSPFELGRASGVDVVVRDPEVSRRHARFTSSDGIVFLEDLASSNGTFLNGRRVNEPIEVRAGDAVDVGTTRILIRAVEPA
jgi:pSer/pThr/pTyr-binding forkhead associated (FHA) protein